MTVPPPSQLDRQRIKRPAPTPGLEVPLYMAATDLSIDHWSPWRADDIQPPAWLSLPTVEERLQPVHMPDLTHARVDRRGDQARGAPRASGIQRDGKPGQPSLVQTRSRGPRLFPKLFQ
jgi:hypothetical protein